MLTDDEIHHVIYDRLVFEISINKLQINELLIFIGILSATAL